MSDEEQPSNPVDQKRDRWGLVIIVVAILSGIAAYKIIPTIFLGEALQPIIGAGSGRVATLFLLMNIFIILLAVAALFGLILTIRNWLKGRKGVAPVREPRFAKIGRIGTLVTSILVLVAIAGAGLLMLLVASQTQQNPEAGFGYLAVYLLGITVLPTLGVPLLVFQIVWSWRPAVSRWEHAVLVQKQPGRKGPILGTRIVAMIAWVPLTAAVIFPAISLIYSYTPAKQQAAQQQADSFVYNEGVVEGSLRNQLLDSNYLIDDLTCPKTIPNPSTSTGFTCTVKSNGQQRMLHVTWSAQPYELGRATVTNPTADGLTSTTDLGQTPPSATTANRIYPSSEVTAAAKAQLIADGWSPTSSLLASLTCPGMGAGYEGHVRCMLGSVYLDVYHTGTDSLTVMTAEVRYLRNE